VRDYREAAPFDVLIKVGPLRAHGWGSAPDAILSAPRFQTLVQIVWAGCGDEQGFGYDPTAPVSEGDRPNGSDLPAHAGTSWLRETTRVGIDKGEDSALVSEIDELEYFSRAPRPKSLRRATLVEFDDGLGALFAPHAQLLSLDPLANDSPFAYRQPGDSLAEGMCVIRPVLDDADLGGIQASAGHYSRIWKARLTEEAEYRPHGLCDSLREAGVHLEHLRDSIRHWCRRPTTVIHAPQQRKHFESLIGVLGITWDSQGSRFPGREWWEYAWAEIARSRGEAIQWGMQEHEIINAELLAVLNDLLPEIRANLIQRKGFKVELPVGRSVSGTVYFDYVISTESSFLAPDGALGAISDLDTIEQWRV
jgi:hypothetical protein